MEITQITPSDENGRREIFVDGAPFLKMAADLVMALDIHVGDEMDDERLQALIDKADSMRALEKAYTYLSYNALSRKTLAQKLKKAGFSDAAAELALDRLEELGLVDDERYAARLLSVMRRQKAWGARKIVFEMKKRGVPEEMIARLMDDGFDERESAAAFFAGKYGKRDLRDPKERRRVIAGMSRYGFSYEDIRAVLAQYEEEI